MSVASMMHRFRTAPPTSKTARQEARQSGAAPAAMWFSKNTTAPPMSSNPMSSNYEDSETQILDQLENSVRRSHTSAPTLRSAAPDSRGSIDDMIAADIANAGAQARSQQRPLQNATNPGANPPPATYISPRSPAEIMAKKPKQVPRFRFQPGAALSPQKPAKSPYYSDEESEDLDFDSDEDSPARQATVSRGDGGFGESLRLATFRGGESDSDSDDTNHYAGRGKSAYKSNSTEYDKENVLHDVIAMEMGGGRDDESIASSDTLRDKKKKKSKGKGKNSYYNFGGSKGGATTAAAITSELDGICEALQSKLEMNYGGSGGNPSEQIFGGNYFDYDTGCGGDLPFTIAQVAQGLEDSLFTFNKLYGDEARGQMSEAADAGASNPASEDEGEPKKKKKKKKKQQDEDEDELEFRATSDTKTLAPLATSLAALGDEELSPKSRARALVAMLETGEPVEMKKKKKEEENESSEDEEGPQSPPYTEDDEESWFGDAQEQTRTHAHEPYSSYSQQGSSSGMDGMGQPYGQFTLLKASCDIVNDLDIAMLSMQKRMGYAEFVVGDKKVLVTDGDDEVEDATKEEKDKDEEELMKVLDAEGEEKDGGDKDKQKKKRLVVKSKEGDEELFLDSSDDSDDDFDLGPDVFGGTRFGWVPNDSGKTYYSVDPRTHTTNPYVVIEKNEGLTSKLEGLEKLLVDTADGDDPPAPVDYPGVSAPTMSPRTAKQQANYNGGERSPRLISTDEVVYRKLRPDGGGEREGGRSRSSRGRSPRVVTTDEVYHRRFRPSSHENENVNTPVTFVREGGGDEEGSMLGMPNREIHAWSYVPRHSREWELKTHLSDQLGEGEDGEEQGRLDSFPSTELRKGRGRSMSPRRGRRGGGGSGFESNGGMWAGSSIKSARKRLDEFKKARGVVRDEWEENVGGGEHEEMSRERMHELTGSPERGGREREGRDSGGGGESSAKKGGSLGVAKDRLEAFRKMREEQTARMGYSKSHY